MSKYKALSLKDAADLAASLPGHLPVVTDDGREVVDVDSYRGFYDHLSIEPRSFGADPGMTLADLAQALRQADGQTFHGYKGGQYVMRAHTPVWVAQHGDASDERLVGIEEHDGKAVLVTVELGW